MEGQAWRSTVVDLAFFVTVCMLGFRGVLHETVLATLLGMYAAGRFGVAHGKQQAVIAMSGGSGGPSSMPPGMPPGSGGSGEYRFQFPSQPTQPATQEAPSPKPKVDPRTLQEAARARVYATESRLAASLGWWG